VVQAQHGVINYFSNSPTVYYEKLQLDISPRQKKTGGLAVAC